MRIAGLPNLASSATAYMHYSGGRKAAFSCLTIAYTRLSAMAVLRA